MALHLKLSQLSSTLVFLCPPVCSGHLTYRKFVARLAKSLVFCTDDTTNILTLPPCSTFTSHLSDPTQSKRLKFGTHICIKILALSRTSRSLHCGFAAKTGTWDTLSYWTCVRCPPSRIRRLYLNLSHMFKIVNNLCYFPPEIVVQRSTVPYSSRPSLLHQPFCRTSAFAHSFVPDTIRKWNCLPIELTSSHTLHSFQSSLSVFTC